MLPPSNTEPFSNPYTYLNYLSPQEALEYETTRSVLLVFLGAHIWDVLATISDDIEVLKRSHFRSTTFCFVFSRCFALAAHAISSALCRSTQTNNIHAAVTASAALGGMSLACSSYLFLQRVRAAYADSPKVQQFFTTFWLIPVLSESTLLFSIKPAYIPETQHFKDSGIQPLLSLVFFTAIAFDSSIFLAISYKIGIAHVMNDSEIGWRRFILGKSLPRLSQAVLRGGQQYYLIVCLVILPGAIILYLPSTPPILKSLVTVPLIPLMASMSCRVYRNIKLFEYDSTTPYPISEIQFV